MPNLTEIFLTKNGPIWRDQVNQRWGSNQNWMIVGGHVRRIDDPGKNNDQVYKEVDWWKRNNPNRYGHHWEAQYTYDSNWNITDVTVVEVQDDYYAWNFAVVG